MADGKIVCWNIAIILVCISMVTADKETCNQKVWCDECITAHPDCAWCKSTDYSEPRCSTMEDLSHNSCGEITYPKNSATLVKNESLQDGSITEDPIQLFPQHIRLKMKPGEKYYLDMKYKVAQNLPIDMYFVLDFSVTMKNRITHLADLTKNLIDGLAQSFTSNIHIGFGSFMDKPIQPFTITVPAQLENPCILGGTICDRAYGYIHRWTLSRDIDKFINTIKKANTSANFDPMEGGLDAVLQASVCPNVIGWRNRSRRVLIHISDVGFHFAGDGKLAGIDAPNDGQCHMHPRKENEDEFIYTHSEYLDYPSFGQIKHVLKQNGINAFFLALEKDIVIYKSLTDFIGNQAETEVMDTTGANKIIDSIKEFYTQLSSKLDIAAIDLPDGINVIAETNCTNSRLKQTFDLRKQSIHCTGLEIGKEVFINVSLQVSECPKDKNSKKTFKLVPSGLQESLLIEVEFICDCECPHSEEMDKTHCSMGNGTYECGVCKCNEGRSGEICQCDVDDESDLSIGEENCKKNNESSAICEDRGSCKCGQCICSTNYDGKYCECDNSNCIAPGTSLKCTNKNQGDCACGKCACKGSYYGEYCECPPRSNCLAENELECSGHGECICGKCVCKAGYNGTHCQDCPRCSNCLKCGNPEQRQCIACMDTDENVDNTTNPACYKICAGLNVTKVARFGKEIQPCDTFVTDNCKRNYIIQCSNDTINLQFSTTRQCVNPPNALLISMPILGGIIGVGLLLLLIWKILTSFYDKIEYAKFEHEIQHPKWTKTDNPMYVSPVTSNPNPAYRGTVE